ncbi:hypothetical protein ACWGJP_13270 [Microbacterium sp. NPDC055903]
MDAMSRPHPLPAHLHDRPFGVGEALEQGVSRSRLRAKDLRIPTRGVRVRHVEAAEEPGAPESPSQRMQRLAEDLITRALEFAPALTPDQFYSGSTGLAILGAPIPYTSADRLQLHVAARHPAGKPRRAGTIGHRLAERAPRRWRARGLPIEHPARLWRQAAAEWPIDDVIAAGDHLVLPRRKLITLADLEEEILAVPLGNAPLRGALSEIRVGSESPGETRLRLVLTRAGLPHPTLNEELRLEDGRFVARLDLAWRRYRVAGEYDGRGHAFDDAQFARNADRWEEILNAGWRTVRILSHHLYPDPQVAVDKVSRALIDAGWRPGRD